MDVTSEISRRESHIKVANQLALKISLNTQSLKLYIKGILVGQFHKFCVSGGRLLVPGCSTPK